MEILTFTIGKEIFGIDVFRVNEIIRADYHITPVPKSSKEKIGVFQPRDKVLTAIDLNYCLFQSTNWTSDHESLHNKYYIMCDDKAYYVDEVRDIMVIAENDVIEPSVIAISNNSHIVGIYKNENELIQIIDFDSLSCK